MTVIVSAPGRKGKTGVGCFFAVHGQQLIDRGYDLDAGKRVVVEARSPELFIIQLKAERLHQVESTPGVGTEANNIASIGWDFGLIEYNVEHTGSLSGV